MLSKEAIRAWRALVQPRDQAKAAERAQSRLLATVSHEIRTPLTGIRGMADLLLDTALSPEQATYARAVKNSADTLLSLLDETLDLSKLEAGQIDLDARPFDLNVLVEETVELLAPRAQAKDIEIAAYVDGRLSRCRIGDAARLRQVLLNLAGNAIKFTDQGGVAVEVKPGPENHVIIEVHDTGTGIPLDQQDRIFLEFQQGEAGRSSRFGGSGLGLAISRRIVERMGGRIAVESAPGAGSVFRVSVALPPTPQTRAATTVGPDLIVRDILIVAANPVGSLLARHLIAWGARTCLIPDARTAAALVPRRAWHAVFIDHALGAAGVALAGAGAEITHRIVLIRPSARHELPILKAAGFSGYLIKPVRVASLAARLAASGGGVERGGTDERRNIQTTDTGSDELTVLVAEDNEINALLAGTLLVKLGHRPTAAGNGGAALEAWRAARAAGEPFGVVLMDVQLPKMNGIETTRRIRAAEAAEGAPRTPIIGLTANAFGDEREASLDAGMDDLLVKPLDRERLADALANILPIRLGLA
ncbi:MAG TPA: ATP-binding protein [Xanthobacteraceae bacterium]|jgi:CheY-like chemotaxis protein/two-component sensor histidine kinase